MTGDRPPIRLFVVDAHPLFRLGVRLATQEARDITVVGEADTEKDAVRALVHERLAADVVLTDVRLPHGGSGLGLTTALATGLPGQRRPRVLTVSACEDDDAVVATLRAGSLGYLAKGVPRDELVRAVRTVACGGAVFSPFVAARLRTYFSGVLDLPGRCAFPQLTDRERQILDLVARGYTNRQIARSLVLAEKTVRNHVSHVFAKLQISDRATAVVRAREAGLGV